MAPSAKNTVGKAVAQRVTGSRPGAFQALLVAVIVGGAAAAATYKALRSGG